VSVASKKKSAVIDRRYKCCKKKQAVLRTACQLIEPQAFFGAAFFFVLITAFLRLM